MNLIFRSGKRIAKLFPSEGPLSDRIVDQLMYVPPDYNEETPIKKILVYNGLGSWSQEAGRSVFINSKCPVNRCTITVNREEAKDADAILYKDQFVLPSVPRPINQVSVSLYIDFNRIQWRAVNFHSAINWLVDTWAMMRPDWLLPVN